ARTTTCVSNCRQIGMALMMYAQDHDEVMPVALAEADQTYVEGYPCQPTSNGTSFPWNVYGQAHFQDCPHKFLPWLLQPYVKSFAVFRCPTLNQSAGFADDRGWDGQGHTSGGSYVYFCTHAQADISFLIGSMAQTRGLNLATVLQQVNVCGRALA